MSMLLCWSINVMMLHDQNGGACALVVLPTLLIGLNHHHYCIGMPFINLTWSTSALKLWGS